MKEIQVNRNQTIAVRCAAPISSVITAYTIRCNLTTENIIIIMRPYMGLAEKSFRQFSGRKTSVTKTERKYSQSAISEKMRLLHTCECCWAEGYEFSTRPATPFSQIYLCFCAFSRSTYIHVELCSPMFSLLIEICKCTTYYSTCQTFLFISFKRLEQKAIRQIIFYSSETRFVSTRKTLWKRLAVRDRRTVHTKQKTKKQIDGVQLTRSFSLAHLSSLATNVLITSGQTRDNRMPKMFKFISYATILRTVRMICVYGRP